MAALVSIIIFLRDDHPYLTDTLDAVERLEDLSQAEVLLCDASTSGLGRDIQKRSSWLGYIPKPGATMPAMKSHAIETASADIVAILDPGSVPPPDWIGNILRAFAKDSTWAAGGSVSFDAPRRSANLAAYLFEYGAFNPPVVAGPTQHDLAGNSVAYRRLALTEGCRTILDEEGFYKPLCHDRIRTLGGTIDLSALLAVRYRNDFRYAAFIARRFHYARCFGATRMRYSGPRRRIAMRVFAPIVPFLLVQRNFGKSLRSTANRELLRHAWLHLIGICFAWGAGELMGCWFGPGESCEKVY